MKKFLAIIIAFVFTSTLFAQVPQKMSYQAVVRNAFNSLITSSTVSMRISVLQGSATGTAVYVETQKPKTNSNGLVSLEIGAGTVVSGSFSAINWATGTYFIKTETDPNGGTNYSIVKTSQLLSVPYALFSANGTPGPQGVAGPTGEKGDKGDKGEAGSQGIAGPQGPIGVTGATGVTGTDGPTGATGEKGDKGDTGPQGIAGPQGPIGVTGATGANGLSAYQIWLNFENSGTEADFIASLKGDKGDKGDQGIRGDQGSVGPTGPQGIQGEPGTIAPGGNAGEMLYWNGSSWLTVEPGSSGQTLTFCNGKPIWGPCHQLPIVAQTIVDNVNDTLATIIGNVLDNGGDDVTERGVCWDTIPNPAVSGNHKVEGAGLGSFVSNINGLTPETHYFVRAYAINANGIGYGAAVEFTTARSPQLLFDLILEDFGAYKLEVVVAVKEITGLGLKEATDLVNAAPSVILTGVSKNDAENGKRKLVEAGAIATVR